MNSFLTSLTPVQLRPRLPIHLPTFHLPTFHLPRLAMPKPVHLVRSIMDRYEDEANGISNDIRNLEQRLQDRAVFLAYDYPISKKYESDNDYAPLISSIEISWDQYRGTGFRLLLKEEKYTGVKGAPRIRLSTPLTDCSSVRKVQAYYHLDKFLTGLAKTTRAAVQVS